MSKFSAISCREQVAFDDMMMSAMYQTDTLGWNIILKLADRHVAQFIILILSQPVFALTP
jgi:hypothetical protein